MTRIIDNPTFQPHVPEKTVQVIITKREAILLNKLRTHQFGKFIIHKANGVPIRIEINDSQLISEQDDCDL